MVLSNPDKALIHADILLKGNHNLSCQHRLGYLGESTGNHCKNFLSLFEKIGSNVAILNNSTKATGQGCKLYERHLHPEKSGPFFNKVMRVRKQLFGICSGSYFNILKKFLVENRPQCIIAYWGTNPFADIVSIKKFDPSIKIILNVLCHPMGLKRTSILWQNILFRVNLRFIDGLIFSSRTMEHYFERHVLFGSTIPTLVSPPLFCSSYFPVLQSKCCPQSPNLIFLGRMDWWEGQPTDNVNKNLNELMDNGIHIYHVKKGTPPYHAFRHLFEPIPFHELNGFANQFDASLIVYNLEACKRDDRFRITIPDRLLGSVTMGIPIAIPDRGYDACKEFLRDYEAVIEFSNPQDLKQKLSNREYIRELKRLAFKNSNRYHGERELPNLIKFISDILL